MVSRICELLLERVFRAWEEVEKNKEDVKIELSEFKRDCANHLNLAIKCTGECYHLYDMYVKNFDPKLTVITKFLQELKNISESSYYFMTEGYDVINIKQHLTFRGVERIKIIADLVRLKDLSVFLEHCIIKILNERNVNKKHLMLRGLIGM